MNVTVTVKVSLHIQACGKGSWAVRRLPSCSRTRQECGQTLHSVLFFQMCLVLNSTAHNWECSGGLTVNGLQVITPPHNMYCTGTQQARYFSHTNKMVTNTHTHARTHPHPHTHNCRNSLCSIAKVNILCIMATIGYSPPLLWIQNICLPFGSGLHCSGVNVRGLKCQSPILGEKTFPHLQTFRFIYSQLLPVECTMNEGSGLVRSTTSSLTK